RARSDAVRTPTSRSDARSRAGAACGRIPRLAVAHRPRGRPRSRRPRPSCRSAAWPGAQGQTWRRCDGSRPRATASARAPAARARHEPLEHVREVLEEAALELVHAHAARRVRRVDAGDPVDDAALPDRLAHLFRDVTDGQTAGRSKLSLVLEDLHRTLTLLRGR